MQIQTFGKKKSALAVAFCKKGKGSIKVNGFALNMLQPYHIRDKLLEPFLLLDTTDKLNIDARIFVKGGGLISRIYAIRQALAKSILLYHLKYTSVNKLLAIKLRYLEYDDKLIFVKNQYNEPKKFGGRGARSRFQKSYR